ncbi:MAG: SDR family oxidoreductase [Flavobacteriales bacterium]|jgi:3-oxoacyl-[acyl-carrier protein] reductase|nr:SDR family oxidoreductase [Flavobacteriales bacterium]MDG1933540.1 SDR family oxidoreductase [Flavobacteriales bacterium]|tara:strand:- start:449 stop:1111 length:663 start_codon:yes stop_codon:yes gene_type:complete
MKILLVGASSDISKSLQNNFSSNYEFISLSSNSDFSSIDNFNILDPATYLEIDSIDGIVYFPGSINLKPFKRLSMDEFKKDYDINVLGVLNILKFYQSKLTIGASVVFISSVAASVGMPFHSSISMCKSSLEALARSLAAEWAPKVRVNCVAPSLVNTKLSERFFRNEKQQEQMNSRHPLNKTGSPEDISNAIEFLLSKKSSWVTGQILNIDGGISSLKI